MRNKNYYCFVFLKNDSELFDFFASIKLFNTFYSGFYYSDEEKESNQIRIGVWYMARHPKTDEIIMRHDFAVCPKTLPYLPRMAVDECLYFLKVDPCAITPVKSVR